MPTEITETELVSDTPKELQVIVQQNSLQPATAQSLQASFAPIFSQARSVIEKSRSISVTDASQKLEMKMARACRLELRAIRVASDKTRKELKDESLRTGRAIDAFHSILLHLTETEEKRLQAQEDFVEQQEAQRKATLKAEREKILAGIQVDPNLYQLGEMGEETFQQLVEGTKLARQAEAERRRKEEADRINLTVNALQEREAKAAAEQERIRLENERLKKEAADKAAAEKLERERRHDLHCTRMAILGAEGLLGDAEVSDADFDDVYGTLPEDSFIASLERLRWRKAEKEKAAADLAESARKLKEAEEKAAAEKARVDAERKATEEKAAKERAEAEALEAKARKEREVLEKQIAKEKAAIEKMSAALRAQNDAIVTRKLLEAEAARKAAAAPDKDRLLNYAYAVMALEIPTLSTPEAVAIANTIKASRDKFSQWVIEKAGAL